MATATQAVPRREPMGFYTDTTVCIGCKACEVACKQWNQLASESGGVQQISGDSYDNTQRLDGTNWRHVKFIEKFSSDAQRDTASWRMMSDVCKHCVQAGCLEVCPTGAIIRTEFDTVVIQADTCNGCRACIAACPFGVIDISPTAKVAQKCTLCYDRQQLNLTPACAQACPTSSINYGPLNGPNGLRALANERVAQLKGDGVAQAQLYGADESILGGLNSFYLIVDEPETYGLPAAPRLPSKNLAPSVGLSGIGAAVMGLLGLVSLRKKRMDRFSEQPEAREQ